MAIRPNKNWIATKVNFQPYARLQPIRSRLPFPERLCAGSATFLADLCFCTQRHDRFVVKPVGNASQADASGTVLAERGLSDFACIPTRIFTALELNGCVRFSSVKREIPGLTPIVIHGRMRLYAPDDCSNVFMSVRRDNQNAFSPRRREEREADQEKRNQKSWFEFLAFLASWR